MLDQVIILNNKSWPFIFWISSTVQLKLKNKWIIIWDGVISFYPFFVAGVWILNVSCQHLWLDPSLVRPYLIPIVTQYFGHLLNNGQTRKKHCCHCLRLGFVLIHFWSRQQNNNCLKHWSADHYFVRIVIWRLYNLSTSLS